MTNLNKAVFVTGGTVGSGLAVAERFAKEGHDVVITSRNGERAAQAATSVAEKHGVHPAIVCLKWAVQLGQVPIPFSIHEAHYVDNLKCVTEDPLTEEEMAEIKALDDPNNRLIKGQVFLWPGATDWRDLWDMDGKITE